MMREQAEQQQEHKRCIDEWRRRDSDDSYYGLIQSDRTALNLSLSGAAA